MVVDQLKHGDIIEISGYYFTWEVRNEYSRLFNKVLLHAVAQGGLMHNDLKDCTILSINGKNI